MVQVIETYVGRYSILHTLFDSFDTTVILLRPSQQHIPYIAYRRVSRLDSAADILVNWCCETGADGNLTAYNEVASSLIPEHFDP